MNNERKQKDRQILGPCVRAEKNWHVEVTVTEKA